MSVLDKSCNGCPKLELAPRYIITAYAHPLFLYRDSPAYLSVHDNDCGRIAPKLLEDI